MLKHDQIEKSVGLLIVLTFGGQRGGLLEIVPLFSRSRQRRRLRA
jgi:cbb3-type cytochrome oxidase cytochrome c subunit